MLDIELALQLTDRPGVLKQIELRKRMMCCIEGPICRADVADEVVQLRLHLGRLERAAANRALNTN
jgi:hypothetical protein